MRKKIVAGNWKMNMTPSEAVSFIKKIKNDINKDNVDVMIFQPFIDIPYVIDLVKDTNIIIGAENFYYEDKGAFTGEISLNMLKDVGVNHVIIGHSERRTIFREDNDTINKKLVKALVENVTPILCVGEAIDIRENNTYNEFIKTQIESAFSGINSSDAIKVIIAYEPIWAIGTGKTATSDEAEEVCKYIRNTVCKLYNENVGNSIRILYGGSVNAKNAKELFSKDNIDGGLVGGASLKDEFIDIVNSNFH